MKKVLFRSRWLIIAIVLALSLIFVPSTVRAAVSDAAPTQENCDTDLISLSYSWDSIGEDRPVVSSMTVDGETIDNPHEPEDGGIGVVICPNTAQGRKTGLTVVRRDGMDYHQDLTGAETPDGDPITANSEITITINDMGSLAQYFSFALANGVVSDWQTDNLGTEDASLSFTISPARKTLVDFMDEGAQFCSATPPVCDAEQSRMDILSASLDMDFDQAGSFAAFTGAYFGLVSAVSGFVEATNDSEGKPTLKVTLGGPHFLEDGSTVNTGSMQAFLPDSVVANLLNMDPNDIDTSSLSVTRTEDGDTDEAAFSVSKVTGGIIVTVPGITFSTPVYTIAEASASSSSSAGAGVGAPNTGLGPKSSDHNHEIALTSFMIALVGSALIRRRILQKI